MQVSVTIVWIALVHGRGMIKLMGGAYRALGLLALAATMSVTARAHAICGRAADVRVLPTYFLTGPPNAEVRLTLRREWRTTGFCTDGARDACSGVTMDLELRAAPANGQPPRSIPFTVTHSESGAFATEVLRPASPLVVGLYEVRAVEHSARVAPLVIALFRVGGEPDRLAPTWAGLTSARWVRRAHGIGGAVVVELECGSPLILLEAARAMDDMTSDGAVRFAIWLAQPGAAIDYTTPPLLYATADELGPTLKISLGSTEESTSNLAPSGMDAKTPYPTRKLGVRAVDLAGNMSAPSEALVR